jgi:hypothetical protein
MGEELRDKKKSKINFKVNLKAKTFLHKKNNIKIRKMA